MPWVDKGTIIQSRTTGRFFLVIEEAPVFRQRGMEYDVWLHPMSPFRDTGYHTLQVRMTTDQLRAFYLGREFKPKEKWGLVKDIEPWEMSPMQLHQIDERFGLCYDFGL